MQTGTNQDGSLITSARIREGCKNSIVIPAEDLNGTTCSSDPNSAVADSDFTNPEDKDKDKKNFNARRTTEAANNRSEPSTVQTAEFRFSRISQCISFQENLSNLHHRRGRRLNGLQLPLHPLQILGWFVLVLFAVSSFWLLIPAFRVELQNPLYGLISGLYIVHVVSHLSALLIDPADQELRRLHRNDRIVPEFDRRKHLHVIENGRCHLCNIRTTSPRTKHCSVCNKCVGKFDHHCKWLNHCIGSRNYIAFLMCVVSAVIATLVIVAAVAAQFVFYFMQPASLRFLEVYWDMAADNGTTHHHHQLSDGNLTAVDEMDFVTEISMALGNESTNVLFGDGETLPELLDNITTIIAGNVSEDIFNNLSSTRMTEIESNVVNGNETVATVVGISVSNPLFLALMGFLGLLGTLTAGLLLHLCFFHMYISLLGLTTYEYIRQRRQAQEAKAKAKANDTDDESTERGKEPPKKTFNRGQIYICSRLKHPNAAVVSPELYFSKASSSSSSNECPQMHCCINSLDLDETALKSYYMCSLLEEGFASSHPLNLPHIGEPSDLNNHWGPVGPQEPFEGLRTFHCCSSFTAATAYRKLSAAPCRARLSTDHDQALNFRQSYMQYTEQCSLCTFRMRSSPPGDCKVAPEIPSDGGQRSATVEFAAGLRDASSATDISHQRCCMKVILKQQRWRKRWNCCSNVPESPDVAEDVIEGFAIRNHQMSSGAASNVKLAANGNDAMKEIKIGRIPTLKRCPGPKENVHTKSRKFTSRSMRRLRHMLCMINRYRRTCCHHCSSHVRGDAAGGEPQIKQNQIRPLQVHMHDVNGCKNEFYKKQFEISSIQLPAIMQIESETMADQSDYSIAGVEDQPMATETILPTSVIRNDTSITYSGLGVKLPPALPPPTRRKLPNSTDLRELIETLSFSSYPSTNALPLSPSQQWPGHKNLCRRRRRRHFLSTRSPTLSPIHESGLSNPASPQPCRHNPQTATSMTMTPTAKRTSSSGETAKDCPEANAKGNFSAT